MTSATDLTDLKAKAATGAFEPGRDGNYGYAHDPADERRDAARRDDARIAVCRAVPALIAERSADAAWMAEARRLLGDIKWVSVDKDNMEFTARITCYQMDALKDALTGGFR